MAATALTGTSFELRLSLSDEVIERAPQLFDTVNTQILPEIYLDGVEPGTRWEDYTILTALEAVLRLTKNSDETRTVLSAAVDKLEKEAYFDGDLAADCRSFLAQTAIPRQYQYRSKRMAALQTL